MIQLKSASKMYQDAWNWLEEDWQRVQASLNGQEEKFMGKRVLLTGAAGFLGFNFLHFFSYLNAHRSTSAPVQVVAVDNYLRGKPQWISQLAAVDPNLTLRRHDIREPLPPDGSKFDFIIHGASIASPKYYRMYPLETLDANVLGLRHMLDLARTDQCQSMLYFSSSEIYGDPPAHEIPTKESYRGHVSCLGPRACYDEAKRVGETLSWLYVQQYGVPVKIVRPFNNYGPGLRLADGRVLPDLSRNVLNGSDLVLYSDGKPTRAFCYASDALTGYLLTLLSSFNGEPFNVGADEGEISMRDLAGKLLEAAQSDKKVIHQTSVEQDYLTDNPYRRCPDISKARNLLGYSPKVSIDDGLRRMLQWYKTFVDLEALEKA